MADSLIGDNQASERDALIAKWKDKSADEVLNAKVESDLYIKTLTSRFDDLAKDHLALKEAHQASTDLKTLIETMKKERENPGITNNEPKLETPTAIKPEDIQSLIRSELAQDKTATKQRENFRMVEGKLKEAFGDNYTTAYKQRLDQLGLTVEYADSLAKDYPAVFLKTFELDNKPMISNQAPPKGTVRNTSFAPNVAKRDWAYYQEMKKTNPKMYLDPKIAIQMHNDAIELGEAFGMPED